MDVRPDDLDFFYGDQADQFTFYRIPKLLFKDDRYMEMSTDSKLLYGLLLDRMNLSARNRWLDDQGRVYIIYTVEEMAATLNFCVRKINRMLNELEHGYGLIIRIRQGFSKPNLIYVKNFIVKRQNCRIMKRKNDVSGSVKKSHHEAQNMRTNNTDINNTDFSDIYPIVSAENETDPYMEENDTDRIDTETLYASYEAYFMEHAELQQLVVDMPEEESTILGILNLLADTCSSKRKVIRIAGDDKPAEVVRGKLMKLELGHIRYVISCMKENATEVRNIRQYLLTSLYNAPDTIGPYYRAKVNNDIAEGRI